MYDYKAYPKEPELAYQYYLDHESQYMNGITKDQLGIDMYDVDGDGQQEIILYINGGDKCPRAGYPFTMLKSLEGNAYKVIPWSGINSSFSTDNSPVKILKTKTFEYKDILLYDNNKPYSIWTLNGRYYDFKQNLIR